MLNPYIKRLYRMVRNAGSHRRINAFVSEYYRKNRDKNYFFTKNVWSGNYLWDYFLQSLPHSEKSEFYVPYDYYSSEIEPRLNRAFSCFVTEKNMYEKVFSKCVVKHPRTIARCMNHIYLDENYRLITDIHGHCRRIREDVMVKPTVETGCGEGVMKYVFAKGVLRHGRTMNFNIAEITKSYSGNFIIQGIVNQEAYLKRLHSFSLNTIRAFSYRSVKTNKVHVTSVMLRMGVGGSFLDNISLGGIACGINDNGTLMKFAFDQYGNSFTHHPDTNIRFENFVVPSFKKVIMAIKILADSVPHQRLIGWDFGIDEYKNSVLIEVNVGIGAWMSQIANGRPLFGDYSQEVKDYIDSCN